MLSGRNVLITFPSISAAIRLEKLCHQSGIPGQLIPTPRSISGSCTMSWSSPYGHKPALIALIRRYGLHVRDVRDLFLDKL